MKTGCRPLFLIAAVCLFAVVAAFGGDKKDKVAVIHNGHVITVAPEAVPAHLRHGDVLVTNDVSITITNENPTLGSIVGPSSVPSGESATFHLSISDPGLCLFELKVNGATVANGALFYGDAFDYTVFDVTSPLLVDVSFTKVF